MVVFDSPNKDKKVFSVPRSANDFFRDMHWLLKVREECTAVCLMRNGLTPLFREARPIHQTRPVALGTGLHVRPESLGAVHRSRAILCRPAKTLVREESCGH
jgi:hypothetical protein